MKNSRIPVALILVLLIYPVFGQVINPTPPPSTAYHTMVKSKETITTYYKIEDGTLLSDLDKVQLKMTKDIRSVSRFHDYTSKMATTIIDRIETENGYADWMIQPVKFVINEYGIAAFDANGDLLNQIPPSSTALDYMDTMTAGTSIFQTMEFMTQTRKDELVTEGVDVTTTAEGEVIIALANKTLTYDYTDKTKTVSRIDADGNVKCIITTRYIPVTFVNPAHPMPEEVLPFIEKEVRNINLPSGVCAELIKVTKRTDYEIHYGELVDPRSKQEKIPTALRWYPNPVSNILTNAAIANTLAYEMKYLFWEEMEYQIEISTCTWWQWMISVAACVNYTGGATLLDIIEGNAADLAEGAALRANAFYDGWQWWLNANAQWKRLIGAITFEAAPTLECTCSFIDPVNGEYIEVFPVNTEDECNSSDAYDCAITATTTGFTMTEEDSDGIVTVSSATAYPDADSGPDNAMVGSNHQQMRNDSNLGIKLDELFDGDHGVYFSVDFR